MSMGLGLGLGLGARGGVDLPPPGYAFLTTNNGASYVTNNGNRIIVRIA